MNLVFQLFERASWFGLAALVVALVAQWVLDGRVPASWRVWLWRVALLQSALALLPLSPLQLAVLSPAAPVATPVSVGQKGTPRLALPAPSDPVVPSTTVVPSATTSSSSPVPSVSSLVALVPRVAPAPGVSPRIETMRASRSFDWRGLVFAFYALGLGVQFVLLLRSWRRVRRMLRACTPVQNAQIRVQLSETARRMNVSHWPRLMQIEGGAPFLVGIFAPAIVLPRVLLATQSRDLEVVLAHELAHQKRRDLVWNALLWPVQALFWFHPLVWIARRFLLLETESACDEMVLSSTRITPKFYGALLVHTMNTQETPFAAGVADSFFALKTRLIRLNRTPKRPHWALRVAFAVALGLAFGALIPLRFVARAQNAASVAPASNVVSGFVRDQNGRPVAGARVYAMATLTNGKSPLKTAVSDARGAFSLSFLRNEPLELLTVARDGSTAWSTVPYNVPFDSGEPIELNTGDSARAKLRFLDEHGRPLAGLRVRLWRVGTSPNYWISLPKSVLQTMRATTNAQGEATIGPLPGSWLDRGSGFPQMRPLLAEFALGSSQQPSAPEPRFAPLSTEDRVALSAPMTLKTFRLLPSASVQGHITLPDGRPGAKLQVMARRINAAELNGGRGGEVDEHYVHSRSDARGNYALAELKPGRYWLWIQPDEHHTPDWAAPTLQQTVAVGLNRFNFHLSGGALVQGVIRDQKTGKPVEGQTVSVTDFNEGGSQTQTDARGFFQLRVLPGKTTLRVYGKWSLVVVKGNLRLRVDNKPPESSVPSPDSSPNVRFDFTVKNGEKREFKFEVPTAPVAKSLTGTVVGPDGKPVAHATVSYRRLTYRVDASIHTTPTDGRGRFAIPSGWAAHPLQIWADAGELTSPRTSIFYGKREVALRVEPGMWASIEGRVVDQNKLPVPGVKLNASTQVGNIALRAQSQTSDAKGHFRFDHLRPETSTTVNTSGNGYSLNGIMADLKAGENYSADIETRRATATLRGRVVLANGAPARGYFVEADGSNTSARTGADGRFFLPQVSDGPIGARVLSIKEGAMWRDFWTRGGDQNAVFRLSQSKRIKPGSSGPESSGPRGDQLEQQAQKLVGQLAPEIQAVRWSSGKAVTLSSLRGQVVVLSFDRFLSPDDNSLNDLASSFPGRVQVVGVQRNMMPKRDPKDNFWFDRAANSARFPLALDAPLSAPPLVSGGRTSSAYNNASYVVISRDGRIVYTGFDLERAVVAASKASQ